MIVCLSATSVEKTTGAEPAFKLMGHSLSTHTLSSSVLAESPCAALHQLYLAELSSVLNSERDADREERGCNFTVLVCVEN